MSEVSEIFTELLFGSGAWIGLVLLISIALLVGYKVKYASALFLVIFIFLGWEYFSHITASSMHFWYFLISMMACIFLGAKFVDDIL
jgi:uncharacterized membrane protein